MRAILVSVDYDDLLSLTLPYNRGHFSSVTVVTSPQNADTVSQIAMVNRADVVVTDLFYQDGAHFNKFAALEYALDRIGRSGWLAILDADVLWPKQILGSSTDPRNPPTWAGSVGQLTTPRRRMYPTIPTEVPPEDIWEEYPLHRNEVEFAGYSQIFHANDPALGPAPWHEINWTHCGGGDSMFQRKWPAERKVRPPWEVLHLGEAGVNWVGRAQPYADGTVPALAGERRAKLQEYIRNRRLYGQGGIGDRYAGERITLGPNGS